MTNNLFLGDEIQEKIKDEILSQFENVIVANIAEQKHKLRPQNSMIPGR